jgi:hypothetical protein
MVDYINDLQKLVMDYLAKEISHEEIVQGKNGAVGLKGVSAPVGRSRTDILEIQKSWDFEKSGELFIYGGSALNTPLDAAIIRALAKLNSEHGFEVLRHAEGGLTFDADTLAKLISDPDNFEPNKENIGYVSTSIKYYIKPKKGPVRDTDLGNFYGNGKSLADILEVQVPSCMDETDTIITRAAMLGKRLTDLPNWRVPSRDN